MKRIFIALIFGLLSSGLIFSAGEDSEKSDNKKIEITDTGIRSPENDLLLDSIPVNSYGYKQIDPYQLKKMLKNKSFKLVNVHYPYQGEIPQTDANIAYNKIIDIRAQFPNKDDLIILYCMSGPMSQYTSIELVKVGYTNIVELKGGTNAWKKYGNSLVVNG